MNEILLGFVFTLSILVSVLTGKPIIQPVHVVSFLFCVIYIAWKEYEF